jgi:hypothetical protein
MASALKFFPFKNMKSDGLPDLHCAATENEQTKHGSHFKGFVGAFA